MWMWVMVSALAAPVDEYQRVYEFPDDYVQGELTLPEQELALPEGELLVSRPALDAAARSSAWRARRAVTIDRRLARERSWALLEERADLYEIDAWEQVVAGYEALDRSWSSYAGMDEAEERLRSIEARADLERRRAVVLYKEASALARGPDAVRLQSKLGYALAELDEGDALARFSKVLQLDPRGPYASEAHLRLADAAFLEADLATAAIHYRAVTGEYVPYATYKLAWTQFNLGDVDEALQSMVAAGAGPSQGLRREAGRDLVRFGVQGDVPTALVAIDQHCGSDGACQAELRGRLRKALVDVARDREAAGIAR